jgi:hypothetical protein
MEGPRGRKSDYGNRGKDERKEKLEEFGGGDDTEKSVVGGLNWLSKNQEPDGRWSSARHDGEEGHDIGVTALALLCYFGWDATHVKEGPYRQNVKKAVDWIVAKAGKDGNLTGGARRGMYDQGIATIALAEAYAMTRDPQLLEPMKKAVDYVLRAQNRKLGGWRYQIDSIDCDMSVAGWEIMALTSARMAGLRVPGEAFDGMRRWLERASCGRHGGKFRYQKNILSGETRTMTAEGMFCRQLLGTPRERPSMAEGAEYLLSSLPRTSKVNYYYWYYATLAMFQHGGKDWDTWNRHMKKTLLELQVAKGKDTGSWPINSEYGKNGGRVMTTAMSILSLEVYYRYLPMYSRGGAENRE